MNNIKHVMFDIDGTLTQSVQMDETLFVDAVESVSGKPINKNWAAYQNVTDTGLVREFCQQHNIQADFKFLHSQIKAVFLDKLTKHLVDEPVKAIPGAISFLDKLINDSHYVVSLATGGWEESARMKLQSAGFNIGHTMLKSSNDDHRRTQIMRLAQSSSNTVYFGDAQWDKTACNQLNFPFILVGTEVEHPYQINNFDNQDKVIAMINSLLE